MRTRSRISQIYIIFVDCLLVAYTLLYSSLYYSFDLSVRASLVLKSEEGGGECALSFLATDFYLIQTNGKKIVLISKLDLAIVKTIESKDLKGLPNNGLPSIKGSSSSSLQSITVIQIPKVKS